MLPKIIIHNAVSVDGRIDWFQADIEKFYDLTSEWNEDATLAGSDTLIAAYADRTEEENMESFNREKDSDDNRPLLIVPDSRGRVKKWHMLVNEPYWRDIIVLVSKSTPGEYLEYLNQRHIEYITAGEEHIDYKTALEEINNRFGVNTIRVDSGGTLNGVLLRAGLVSEVSILVHPFLVGGTSPRSIFRSPDLDSSEGVIELKLSNIKKLDGDLIWIRYEVLNPE